MEDASEETRTGSPDREVREAIAAVRAGEAEAFGRVVELHWGRIMSLAAVLMRDAVAAEELAQDVFVRAYRHLGSFDARRPLMPWLAKIAYRLAQTRRQQSARIEAIQRQAEAQAETKPGEADPLTKLIADESTGRLWAAVRELPPRESAAVLLYYQQGMSIPEVAQVIGVSRGAIKTYLFRARGHLHRKLGAGMDEEHSA